MCRKSEVDVDRGTLKIQLQKDGVEYLLVQFVDIHGSAKVKMVPRGRFATSWRRVPGFAGGAVWGMGQNAASHDMMARIDRPRTRCAPGAGPGSLRRGLVRR